MADLTFTDKMNVNLVSSNITDEMVLHAARVSTSGELGSTVEWNERDQGLIKYLMRENHVSPFEHGSMTLFVHAPIFVFREWMRHRTQSFNEESGRYRELGPTFYVPNAGRPLVQHGKVGHYTFDAGPEEMYLSLGHNVKAVYNSAYAAYQRMLEEGVAKEVARIVLPVGLYSSMYVTSNLRNWLAFLGLRTAENAQWEIRDCANQVESILTSLAPRSVLAWKDK